MKKLKKEREVGLVDNAPADALLTEARQDPVESSGIAPDLIDQSLASEKSVGDDDTLAGSLKLVISLASMLWFLDHLEDFSDLYPSINLEFIADEEKLLYLETDNISDVFVGFVGAFPPANTPFIWQKVGRCHWGYYAHKDYLSAYGTPTCFTDLDTHRIIRYTWDLADYGNANVKQRNPLLYEGRPYRAPRKHVISTDDVRCCRQMVECGLGIGFLPCTLAKDKKLVRVLDGVPREIEELEIYDYCVYPPHLKDHVRVKAFIEFILQRRSYPSALLPERDNV